MTNEHDKLIERLNGAKQRYFDDAVLKQLIIDCKAALISPEAPRKLWRKYPGEVPVYNAYKDIVILWIFEKGIVRHILRKGLSSDTVCRGIENCLWCYESDLIASIPTAKAQDDGVAKRLYGIGNGNPPAVIRELTKTLTI